MLEVRVAQSEEDYQKCLCVEFCCHSVILEIMRGMVRDAVDWENAYLAEEDGQTVGYACLAQWDEKTVMVYALEVLPNAERVKVVSKILRKIEEVLLIQGEEIEAILLQVFSDDLAVLRQVAQLGYEYKTQLGEAYLVEKTLTR